MFEIAESVTPYLVALCGGLLLVGAVLVVKGIYLRGFAAGTSKSEGNGRIISGVLTMIAALVAGVILLQI